MASPDARIEGPLDGFHLNAATVEQMGNLRRRVNPTGRTAFHLTDCLQKASGRHPIRCFRARLLSGLTQQTIYSIFLRTTRLTESTAAEVLVAVIT